MALRRLGAAVGGAVAAHHVGGAVAEEVLDVQFARVVGDGPGGKGVAEAMGMDPGNAGSPAQPPQELLEPIGPEPHGRLEPPVAGGEEQRPRGRSPVNAIGSEGVGAAGGEGDEAVLAAFAPPHEQAALREPAVGEIQVGRLRTADAGIEERQEDRPIAAPPHRGGIAAGQQPSDLLRGQGRHDRLGQAHVAEPPEGIVAGIAGGAQPGPEAAHLAEGAVAGGGTEAGEAGEVGDDVIGAAAVRIERGCVLLEAAQEAGERLAVGGEGAGRFPLDAQRAR